MAAKSHPKALSRPRLLSSALAAGAALVYAAGAGADPVYPGCAAAPQQYAHAFVATPTTLASALAQAMGGDIIYLKSGAYGKLVLNQYGKLGPQKYVYSQFLTIAAAPGQTPAFTGIILSNASHIILKGLTVTGLRAPLPTAAAIWPRPLVNIVTSNNIIFENNTVASQLNAWPWTNEPPQMISAQIPLTYQYVPSDGIGAADSSCVSLSANLIYNVMNGIQVFGDQIGNDGKNFLIQSNHIDNFAWDGIDHGITNIIIRGNLITNNHNICMVVASCPHNDGIQGWNYEDKPIPNNNVVIDGNTIIGQTVQNLPVPGPLLNGITIFDGFWNNVVISNNAVILADSSNGITMAGVHQMQIVNNTVVGTDPAYAPRVNYGNVSNEGGLSSNITVRNNIAPTFAAYGIYHHPGQVAAVSTVADHNLAMSTSVSSLVYTGVTTPKAIFQNFDPVSFNFNLQLNTSTKGNPAVGTGTPTSAPVTNILGLARAAPVNLGAY